MNPRRSRDAGEKILERLTDATAKAAKPDAVARDLADGTVAGLALRVLPSGVKTWALRARLNGQRIRVDLGTYPATTLKDARRKAQDALRIVERGDDPRYEGITVAEAVTEYLNSKIGDSRERSLANERRRFELHVLPAIGTYGIRTVKPARLSALLRGIATGADPKPVEANRVYTSLRGLFRWCRRNMGCPDDPTAMIDKPTREEPSVVRRREGTQPLLDMNELAALWNASGALPGSVLPDLLRCLLLVPLRREEWNQLQWHEVRDTFTADGWKGAALRIPAARMKGRRPAIVPISPAVVEILNARHKLTGSGDYVFAVSGKNTHFTSWSHGTGTLRTALGKRTDWSVHTIRASVATAMVRDLGAEELLVGRLLQHSARSVLGVTDTYQRSSRLAEQAELLGRWSAHLQAVALALETADKHVVALPVVERRRATLSDVSVMARAKKAKISSEMPTTAFDAHIAAYWANALAPPLDAHITAYWTNALEDFFSFPAKAFDAHIGAYWTNKLKAFFSSPAEALAFSETFEREEREHNTALAKLVAPGVPPSAVLDRLNPLHAALEPSLFEDDPDTRAAMREKALALSALHYAEITKATRSTMEKAALLRERVMAEEPLARASVRKEQDARSKPAKRIETLVHQRIAETLGISVRQVQRILSRR